LGEVEGVDGGGEEEVGGVGVWGDGVGVDGGEGLDGVVGGVGVGVDGVVGGVGVGVDGEAVVLGGVDED